MNMEKVAKKDGSCKFRDRKLVLLACILVVVVYLNKATESQNWKQVWIINYIVNA